MKNKSPRVLVLGTTGMLGRFTYAYLTKKHENVFGSSRSKENSLYYDFNKSSLSTLINKVKPDFVINCIGVLRQKPDIDYSINYELPVKLEKLSEKNKYKIINISTDAVFSNTSGVVNESSKTNPEDKYSKSKLKGEVAKNTLTIRTSIIGLDPYSHKGILEHILNNKKIEGYINQKWSGSTTIQLAKLFEWIIYKGGFEKISKRTNVIHFSPIYNTTKYKIVEIFAKKIGGKSVVKSNGIEISRLFTTKYIDELPASIYNTNLDKALNEIIQNEKKYLKKFI